MDWELTSQTSVRLRRIFSIKERMRTKPILILISDKKELRSFIADGDIPHTAERLMNAFWPGPLTIVFRASESVSPLLTAYTGKDRNPLA